MTFVPSFITGLSLRHSFVYSQVFIKKKMYWGIHMCQKNEMHQWTRWISPCSRVFRMLVVEMIHRYIREIVSGSGKNCAARMELNRNRAFLQKGRTLRYDVEDRSQLMMIWGKSIPGRRKSTCKCPELGMSLGGWRWGKEAQEAGSQREWKVRFFFFNILAMLHGLWDLSFLTRDQTLTSCSGS